MTTTRVFKSGNSLAVRLPKEFALPEGEVEIFKRDGELVIREKPKNLARAWEIFSSFSEDFFEEGRKDDQPFEQREEL